MNNPRDAGDGGAPAAAARVRHSRWPGWIWTIPVAAIAIVAWMGLRAVFSGGRDVTILFDDAHGMKAQDTDVECRGLRVGHVKGIELAPDGHSVKVTASIDGEATRLLRSGTRFWLRGGKPSLSDLRSLSAVLSGPTIVMDPGNGAPAEHFTGLVRKPISPTADAPKLTYAVRLHGDAGELEPGDPVTWHGFTVGEVRQVGLMVDPDSGEVTMPATLALYPALFQVGQDAPPPSRADLQHAILALLGQGLRVRLQQEPPLIGSHRLVLQLVPGAPAARLKVFRGLPELPLAEEAGLQSLMTRLGQVPVEQIAANVLAMTNRLRALSASPRLDEILAQLAATLQDIHRTTSKSGPQVSALIASLRRTSGELEQASRTGNEMLSGTATQDGLPGLINEAAEASRAVRSLADYLDTHPEALIRGRDTP